MYQMGLVDQIRLDIQAIRTNLSDFGVAITMTAPTSPLTVLNTKGTVKKHHTKIDDVGLPVRSKGNTINASATVSMLSLNAVNYPYRNDEERVTLKGHLVSWTDVSGTYTYSVEEWYPNEVAAELVMILALYGSN